MKNLLVFSFYLLVSLLMSLTYAQEKVEYVDDEECGCELVFIDGIQTTQDGDRFGFKREDGTVIVPNKYMFVDRFHVHFAVLQSVHGL